MSITTAVDGKLFINGAWREGTARLEVVNPATEETIGSVVAANSANLKRFADLFGN